MCSFPKVSLCRLCLCNGGRLIDIFRENHELEFVVEDVLEDLLQIHVKKQDGLPWQICSSCLGKLTDFRLFKIRCLECKFAFENRFPEWENFSRDEEMLEGNPSEINQSNRSWEVSWHKVPAGHLRSLKENIKSGCPKDGRGQGFPGNPSSELPFAKTEPEKSNGTSPTNKRTANQVGGSNHSTVVDNCHGNTQNVDDSISTSTHSRLGHKGSYRGRRGRGRSGVMPGKVGGRKARNKGAARDQPSLPPCNNCDEDAEKCCCGMNQNVGHVPGEDTDSEDGEVWLSGPKRKRAALQRWYWELEKLRSKSEQEKCNAENTKVAPQSVGGVSHKENSSQLQDLDQNPPTEGEWYGGMPKIVNVCCTAVPQQPGQTLKAGHSLLRSRTGMLGHIKRPRVVCIGQPSVSVGSTGVHGGRSVAGRGIREVTNPLSGSKAACTVGRKVNLTPVGGGAKSCGGSEMVNKAKCAMGGEIKGLPRSFPENENGAGSSLVVNAKGVERVKSAEPGFTCMETKALDRISHENKGASCPSIAVNSEDASETVKKAEHMLIDVETKRLGGVSYENAQRLKQASHESKALYISGATNSKKAGKVMNNKDIGLMKVETKELTGVSCGDEKRLTHVPHEKVSSSSKTAKSEESGEFIKKADHALTSVETKGLAKVPCEDSKGLTRATHKNKSSAGPLVVVNSGQSDEVVKVEKLGLKVVETKRLATVSYENEISTGALLDVDCKSGAEVSKADQGSTCVKTKAFAIVSREGGSGIDSSAVVKGDENLAERRVEEVKTMAEGSRLVATEGTLQGEECIVSDSDAGEEEQVEGHDRGKEGIGEKVAESIVDDDVIIISKTWDNMPRNKIGRFCRKSRRFVGFCRAIQTVPMIDLAGNDDETCSEVTKEHESTGVGNKEDVIELWENEDVVKTKGRKKPPRGSDGKFKRPNGSSDHREGFQDASTTIGTDG